MAARPARALDVADLAARLERLSAAAVTRIVDSASHMPGGSAARWVEISGGVAAYLGPGSPMNHAVGVGMGGRVAESDVDALEEFYRSRGERPLAVVCELADRGLASLLRSRGWTFDGFENVLVRFFDDADSFPQTGRIEVFEAVEGLDREKWAMVAAEGFSAPESPLAEQVQVALAAAACPESRLFIACVDGEVAGVGELTIAEGVGWLSADATLPRFRRRGVQGAIQSARLSRAAEAGCEFAVSEAAPDGASQRNMERLGFRVVYRRMDFVAQP